MTNQPSQSTAEAAGPGLANEHFIPFRVLHVVPESDSVTSFYLVPANGRTPLPFLPGQFLSVAVDPSGQGDWQQRSYTVSSSPNRNHYRISIKREAASGPGLPTGLVSHYFHERIGVGDTVAILSPQGHFHLDLDDDSPVALVSAGVGITPMVSMVKTLCERGQQRPVLFVHGARHGQEHPFKDHLRRLARAYPWINLHHRYSQPASSDLPGHDYHSTGRVNAALLTTLVPNLPDYHVYLCGPTGFMQSLYQDLQQQGLPRERLHYEFFGPAGAMDLPPVAANLAVSLAVAPAASPVAPPTQVRLRRAGISLNWDQRLDSLLDLLLINGIKPAYSCRAGICKTCCCPLLSGTVSYDEAPLDMPAEGKVLICSARPNGDVELDL